MNAFGSLPLPTDNLYKFCALTGVAIFLFSCYVGWRLSDDLIQRVNAQNLAVEKAKIEVDYLERFVDRLGQIVDNTKANLGDEDALKQGKIPLHVPEEDLRKMIQRKDELVRDSRLKIAELNSATREIAQAESYLKFIRIVGTFWVIAGFLLAVYGFIKWIGVQKMQDKVLERQFAELQKTS